MYNSGMVVVVKSNGKILREDKDLCFLPFNSEYSILLKNLETRKALVKISIDGQDVLDGHSLILNPNSETELEGFMKGNIAKNKFKFIKKTEEISDYRGDRIDDGIIRVEYWFEEIKWYSRNNSNFTYDSSVVNYGGMSINSMNSLGNNYRSLNTSFSKSIQDEGITVKGSEVNQNFVTGSIGKLEQNSKVIILKLIGVKESGKNIEKPITIQTRKTCSTCGKKSKSHLKFCSNCGTFLE